MAAKPKLTPEEWTEARTVWEADTRKGFAWLVDELELPVTEEACRQKSKRDSWGKTGAPSLKSSGKRCLKSNIDRLREDQFQQVFCDHIESGMFVKVGWPAHLKVFREYRIGTSVCDVVVFHADGSVTVCELKRAGLSIRDYMTGVGQVMHAAMQVGMSLQSQKRRSVVRMVLAAPGGPIGAVEDTCSFAGVKYIPFDGQMAPVLIEGAR